LELYQASQASNPNYFKSIKDAPEHIKTLKESGTIRPIGVKQDKAILGDNAEARMTVRQLQGPDRIKALGTDRTSWTKDADGAVLRADGDRGAVVRVNPDEVNSALSVDETKVGRFKKAEEVLADVQEAQGVAKNSKERSKADYAMKNATKFSEGHAVGATPAGTVRPIGFWEGRSSTVKKFGNAVGFTSGLGATIVVSGLSGSPVVLTPDGRVDVEFSGIFIDPHLDQGFLSEVDYELGLGPEPQHMKVDKDRSFAELLPVLIMVLLFL
jgi:hypothetical protein